MHVRGPEIMDWAFDKMHKTLAIIAQAKDSVDYSTGWGDYTVIEKPAWL